MQAKYDKIAEAILKSINSGEYNERLPAEQKLAQIHKTSTMTVRKALDTLTRQGHIVKVPHVGNFPRIKADLRISVGWRKFAFGDYNDVIQRAIKNHFPEYEITFMPASKINDESPPDLQLVPSTTPICYSLQAMPYPREVIRRYLTDEYLQVAFQVHRINHFYYALPVLFSPVILQWDRPLLANYDIAQLNGLCWCDLPKLGKYALEHGCSLWNLRTLAPLMRSLVFSCGTTRGEAGRIDIKLLKHYLDIIKPVLTGKAIAVKGDDNCLMGFSCRQNFMRESEPERWLITPVPAMEPGIMPWTMAAGEYITVSPQSRYPEEAIRIAEYLLSPEIQKLIGKYRLGIPVLKSAALDSLNFRNGADSIFYGDLDHMLVNNASEQEFLARLDTLTGGLVTGTMDYKKFIANLEYEISIAGKEQS